LIPVRERTATTLRRHSAVLLILVIVATGCGARDGNGSAAPPDRSAAPPLVSRRLVTAIMGDPPALRGTVATSGSTGGIAGLENVEELLNVGLVTVDHLGRLHPHLAEAVPTVENGQWKLLPDGRMETRWRIRPGARWHDGTPFTADDLTFTFQVGADPEIALFPDPIFQFIESVEAADAQTVLVRWKQPYIDADAAFQSGTMTAPLPRHLLSGAFAGEKSAFGQLPYWGPDYVGTGPYRLKELVRGSHLLLERNEQYVLGPPRIPEIEVRFVPDANILYANILAGAVEMTLGRALSIDQALQLRTDWKDGHVETAYVLWSAAYPQLMTPSPAIIGDPRFRRALMYAVDRQELVDTLQGGLGWIAHSVHYPDIPEYKDVDRAIVKYDYDPRQARAIIEQLGYTLGPDGSFRDAGQQRLAVEVRHTTFDIEVKTALAVTDNWQRAGIAAEPLPITPQRSRDREWRSTFPGFELLGNPGNLQALARIRISQTPLPENSYTGTNRARYVNPEFDGLLERYFNTISKVERAPLVAQIVHHLTDQAIWMGMYHRVDPSVIPNRIANVWPRAEDCTQAWNAHEWELIR
jgi:peptide/nickel transport system substrate-binding protein